MACLLDNCFSASWQSLAGLVLSFARGLGEFGATLMIGCVFREDRYNSDGYLFRSKIWTNGESDVLGRYYRGSSVGLIMWLGKSKHRRFTIKIKAGDRMLEVNIKKQVIPL